MKKLIAFGEYLLSKERRKSYKSHPRSSSLGPIEDRLSSVSDADIKNFEHIWSKNKSK